MLFEIELIEFDCLSETFFLKANLPMVNPLTSRHVPRLMSLEDFKFAFCNEYSDEQTLQIHTKYAVYESKGVPRDSTTQIGHVDFEKPHPPLLFLCGDKDQIVPSILNQKNFDRFKAFDAKNNSRTEFKEFKGLTHGSIILGDEKDFTQVVETALQFIATL